MDKKRKNEWTETELTYLKSNYEVIGLKNITNVLTNHTNNSIANKASQLGIKVDQSIYHYDVNLIRETIKTSDSYKEVLNKLNKSVSGASYDYLIRFIKKHNIDVSHFGKWRIKKNVGKALSDWLKEGTSISSSSLKTKLYSAGLKERKCEKCKQGENWNGEHMSLILDHINGINNDNRFENLRIVCPNCNATLPTHCRGQKKMKK
jgi:hypothetical protein